MNSFPRSAWTIGACSRRASSISSACAPAQPEPPKIVIRLDSFSIFANAAISSSDGQTCGVDPENCGRACCPTASRNATLRPRRLDRDLEDAGHLLRLGHELTVVAALREEMLRVGFL